MKIIIVGGTGTIGQAIVKELAPQHEIITAGVKHGDVQVDITHAESIEKMYQTTGTVDAIIAATGEVHFGPFIDLTASQMQVGLQSKLMGQVNLVLLGLKHLTANGSFTLTSGILNQDPIRYGTCASLVNGALESFVLGAAIEMPNNIRINVVSPTVLEESIDKYAPYFAGFVPVPASRVAKAYRKSVEGAQTGQVYRVW